MNEFIVEINLIFLVFIIAVAYFSYQRGYKEGVEAGMNTIIRDIRNVVGCVVHDIIRGSNLTKDEAAELRDAEIRVDYEEDDDEK
jgi:hypothetical protein